MSVVVKEFSNSKSRRYDAKILKENGLFEDDQNFSFRLMFYQTKELSEKELKDYVKQMLKAKKQWSEGKEYFTYNFQDGTGFINKKQWLNS